MDGNDRNHQYHQRKRPTLDEGELSGHFVLVVIILY